MPFQIEQLLEGKGSVITVLKEDTVTSALALMIEHDFSQLPVISKDGDFENVEGLITYEEIVRSIRNFKLHIEDLKVGNVMGKVSVHNGDDDLFDILDRLKETNAVIILNKDFPFIEGIITSYDATEYFRNRTEDLMRVQDIEVTIKDLIKEAYRKEVKDIKKSFSEDEEIDEEKLDKMVKVISQRGVNSKPKTFDELTLAEYINLLVNPDTWDFYQPIFNLPNESVKNLLHSTREIRNLLAHFRGDISAEQRDRLKFTADWLARCQIEHQKNKEQKMLARIREQFPSSEISKAEDTEQIEKDDSKIETSPFDYMVTESTKSGGRYAALADWLQSQPGRIEQTPLTFNEIEKIIGSDLPESARYFRAWWANDSVGHTHSQLWLDAGWRTTYINLSEGKVTFSRIREREKAYIDFFGALLNDLRRSVNFLIKDVSPDGASWIVIQRIPRLSQSFGSYVVSFSRTKKLRVELYLDLLDKEQTKLAFEKLHEKKGEFETQINPLEITWERLENRRASRIALYKDGQITDESNLPELRKWAVNAMYKLYNITVEPAEKIILEIKNGE